MRALSVHGGAMLRILQIVQDVEHRYGTGAWMPGEIRPTVTAPVLVSSDESIHTELQSWGYKMPDNFITNTRTETAADKPMFRATALPLSGA